MRTRLSVATASQCKHSRNRRGQSEANTYCGYKIVVVLLCTMQSRNKLVARQTDTLSHNKVRTNVVTPHRGGRFNEGPQSHRSFLGTDETVPFKIELHRLNKVQHTLATRILKTPVPCLALYGVPVILLITSTCAPPHTYRFV